MAKLKRNRKKIAKVIFKPKYTTKQPEGIVIGGAYDFLFEEPNNQYDDEYADYI